MDAHNICLHTPPFSSPQEVKDLQAELNSLKETVKHHREEIDQYNKESGLMERRLRIAQAGGAHYSPFTILMANKTLFYFHPWRHVPLNGFPSLQVAVAVAEVVVEMAVVAVDSQMVWTRPCTTKCSESWKNYK